MHFCLLRQASANTSYVRLAWQVDEPVVEYEVGSAGQVSDRPEPNMVKEMLLMTKPKPPCQVLDAQLSVNVGVVPVMVMELHPIGACAQAERSCS